MFLSVWGAFFLNVFEGSVILSGVVSEGRESLSEGSGSWPNFFFRLSIYCCCYYYSDSWFAYHYMYVGSFCLISGVQAARVLLYCWSIAVRAVLRYQTVVGRSLSGLLLGCR